MRLILWIGILLFGCFMTVVYADAGLANSPVGYWKTIDDVTGQPKSIVHIWKNADQMLFGQVIKIFPRPGEDPNKLCTACVGERRNQPIVGMVILSGLRANQNQWSNGQILDPENGKTYNCTVRVADNGQRLNVHGFIGIPILGRSQSWQRVDLMSSQ